MHTQSVAVERVELELLQMVELVDLVSLLWRSFINEC
jgi:hypothetical protein